MKIDLSAPVKELKDLLPLFFAEAQRPQVQSWLNTLRPGEVTIQSDAVRSQLLMELNTSPLADKGPEITQSDSENLSRNWETWDAFFVCEIQALLGQPLERIERDEIFDTLISMVVLRGDPARGLTNTLSFTVEGTDSIALLAALDLAGICASSGSACTAGSLTPSHVLLAMGVPPALANSFVRFSLGRETRAGEIDAVIRRLPELIEQCRRR